MKKSFNKFSYLLNLQILRDLKITLGSALGIMLLSVGYFTYNLSYEVKYYLERTENVGAIQLFSPFDSFSNFFNRTNSRLLILLLLTCFCIYCIYLWVGEFRGENKSGYTLLTLPIKRISIISYKFLAAAFYYLALVFFQILALFINYLVFNSIVPKDGIIKESFATIIANTINTFYGIIPITLSNILTQILFFIAMVVLSFLFALLGRSYGVKGGILGLFLGISFLFVTILLPIYLSFYTFEKFIWFVLVSILYNLIAFLWCKYLLEKKVHV